MISYDSPRGGVSVLTVKDEKTTSFLLIKNAKPSDSGHYQCNPANSIPKNVTVHILNGKYKYYFIYELSSVLLPSQLTQTNTVAFFKDYPPPTNETYVISAVLN